MLNNGDVLQNRYRIINRLGEGGMGTVYQAEDTKRFNKNVALKEVLFNVANKNPEHFRRAFEREAKILTQIEHEAVPKVIDYFLETNHQFLVMELIEGQDLTSILAKRKTWFPIENVLNWANQLLDALDYLHTLNPAIIHRDIKPQNLKLNSRGKIKLLDFGIAKDTDAELAATLTDNTFIGATLHYSPFEQLVRLPFYYEPLLSLYGEKVENYRKQSADARSDIYSLGATLYHLATNVEPLGAYQRTLEVWSGKFDPLPPPHKIVSQISPDVSAFLLKAMELERENRYSSSLEMKNALQELIVQEKRRDYEEDQSQLFAEHERLKREREEIEAERRWLKVQQEESLRQIALERERLRLEKETKEIEQKLREEEAKAREVLLIKAQYEEQKQLLTAELERQRMEEQAAKELERKRLEEERLHLEAERLRLEVEAQERERQRLAEEERKRLEFERLKAERKELEIERLRLEQERQTREQKLREEEERKTREREELEQERQRLEAEKKRLEEEKAQQTLKLEEEKLLAKALEIEREKLETKEEKQGQIELTEVENQQISEDREQAETENEIEEIFQTLEMSSAATFVDFPKEEILEVPFVEPFSPPADEKAAKAFENSEKTVTEIILPEFPTEIEAENKKSETVPVVASAEKDLFFSEYTEKPNKKAVWILPVIIIGLLFIGIGVFGMWVMSGNSSSDNGNINQTVNNQIVTNKTTTPDVSPTPTPISEKPIPASSQNVLPNKEKPNPTIASTVKKTPVQSSAKTPPPLKTPAPTQDPNCVFTNTCK